MTQKNPYSVIKHQLITEKSTVLEQLKDNSSNPCVKRFENPKYVFVVDNKATKPQIASALEEMYKDQKIKVVSVNTINVKGKTRRVRGRVGVKPSIKKAIVTLAVGDSLENL